LTDAGALLAAHIDAGIAALDWAEIAAATGARKDCVAE